MVRMINTDLGYGDALSLLRGGGIVAVPTETVYGLAANATNGQAVERIFRAKNRPNFNPLIAHVSGLDMAKQYGKFGELSLHLVKHFWPGPLTIVVPLQANSNIADAVTAGLNTIALRHPIGMMAKLAEGLGVPLAAPSANSSGKLSPTLAVHVAEDLGNKVDLILDGGPTLVGVESTILKIENSKATLLREGGLSVEKIEAVTGPVNRAENNSKIEAPGMMLSHYAPTLPLRLNAKKVASDEALLIFGSMSTSGAPHIMRNLSRMGDLGEAARNLFAMLKELDKSGASAIAVQAIPRHDLGAAINDRLTRAVAKSEQEGEQT